MKRKGICLVTGMAEKRLDTMVTRGQWQSKSPGLSHSTYSLEDAFRLRFLLVAMDQVGLDFETAKVLLSGCSRRNLGRHPLNHPSSEAEMWVALVLLRDTDPELDPTLDPDIERFTIGGRLEDLHLAAQTKLAASYEGCALRALVTVNASACADHVRKQAHDIGLPEAMEFPPIWHDWKFPTWQDREMILDAYGEEAYALLQSEGRV